MARPFSIPQSEAPQSTVSFRLIHALTTLAITASPLSDIVSFEAAYALIPETRQLVATIRTRSLLAESDPFEGEIYL